MEWFWADGALFDGIICILRAVTALVDDTGFFSHGILAEWAEYCFLMVWSILRILTAGLTAVRYSMFWCKKRCEARRPLVGICRYLLPLHIVIYWVWDELVEAFTCQERYTSADTGRMIRPRGYQFEDLNFKLVGQTILYLMASRSILNGFKGHVVS